MEKEKKCKKCCCKGKKTTKEDKDKKSMAW